VSAGPAVLRPKACMKAEALVDWAWVAKEDVESDEPAPALPFPLVPSVDATVLAASALKTLPAPALTSAITPIPFTTTSLTLLRWVVAAAEALAVSYAAS